MEQFCKYERNLKRYNNINDNYYFVYIIKVCNKKWYRKDNKMDRKTILVFLSDNYADWELGYIAPVFNNPNRKYIIKTVGLKEQVRSQGGLLVTVDYLLENCIEDFEALVLIGGTFWEEVKYTLEELKIFIDSALSKDKLVASICDSSTFLANNKYLNKRKHTGNGLEYLKEKSKYYDGEGLYILQQAVYDENIITANGTSSLEFTKSIMEVLKPMPLDEINKWYDFYKKGFYSDYIIDTKKS